MNPGKQTANQDDPEVAAITAEIEELRRLRETLRRYQETLENALKEHNLQVEQIEKNTEKQTARLAAAHTSLAHQYQVEVAKQHLIQTRKQLSTLDD
ncbi:hypothetical protein KGQ71_01630 [Patescibacteria group bacterium]|nr:hypothetical protein [Patescibacteria group bacterium]